MNRALAFFFCGLTVAALGPGCQAEGRDFGNAGAGGAGGAGVTSGEVSSSTGMLTNCTMDADCPIVTVCAAPSCDTAGACVGIPVADGPNSALSDLPNDCVDYVCSSGVETAIPDDTEVPDDVNPCATPSCSGGSVMYANVAAGTACGAGFCDGAGQCADCYADGLKNGAETDIDCGGAGVGCVTCELGKICASGADCVSTNCCTACSYTCLNENDVCIAC